MIQDAPKVSIGLPVFNGENYLAEAIESILGQTYQNFECIITDNASTDKTEEICRAYAEADERIRYFRNEHNLGAAPNFNKSFDLSSGKYFKWAAHDDTMAPTFVEKCVEVLETQSDVVLCYPGTSVINSEGIVTKEYAFSGRTNSADLPQRFAALLLSSDMCYEIFGLIRTDVLAKTSLMGNFGHGDGVLLARLCLNGRFHEIPEHLLFVRSHDDQSMAIYKGTDKHGRPDYYSYTDWFDSSKKGKLVLPNWKMLYEFAKTPWQVSLNLTDRAYCHFHLARWGKRHWRYLVGDINYAARYFLNHRN
ncbi:MAG: glycosyltransferase family 2 protein [Anaerolineae bacterium]|nr:glycosyltransferase family 2 protein [Anaerolineae bacterium]